MPNVKVSVPREGDEVTVRYAGGEPVVYKVKDGIASVPEEHAQDFANAVGGSVVGGGTPASTSKE